MRSYNEKNDRAEQGDGGVQDAFVGHLGVQGAIEKGAWHFYHYEMTMNCVYDSVVGVICQWRIKYC